MHITSEAEMLAFGQKFAQNLRVPVAIELVGDVGAGKTTFVRGLAQGLGITEPVTSPSFTISKRYAFPLKCCKNYNTSAQGELLHYDFYRLDDPGIMRDELEEALSNPHAICVIEWGGSVLDLLPKDSLHLEIQLNADGSRTLFCDADKE